MKKNIFTNYVNVLSLVLMSSSVFANQDLFALKKALQEEKTIQTQNNHKAEQARKRYISTNEAEAIMLEAEADVRKSEANLIKSVNRPVQIQANWTDEIAK